MLIVFFIILLVILYFSYEFTGRNIYSPSFMLSAGYSVTTIFAIYNEERWGTEVSFWMLLILLIGIFSFTITQLFLSRIFPKPSAKKNSLICYQMEYLQKATSSISKVLLVTAVSLIMSYFLYLDVIRIAYINFREWGNLLYNFKSNISDYRLSSLSTIGFRWTKAFAYFYLFVFINNISDISKTKWEKIRKNIIFLLPCLVYIGQSLLIGGRISIVMFIIAALFLAYLIKFYKYRKWMQIDIKKIIIAAVFFVAFCVFFYEVQELIGRQQESEGILDYIASYLGGSIDLFSQYIREPMGRQEYIETFSGIISNLQNYFGMFLNVQYHTTHEFRRAASGVLIGNTYTGFRNYYNDFGLSGVFIFTVLLSLIFCGVYYIISQYNSLNRMRVFLIITYSMLLYCIPFHFFTDYFFLGVSISFMLDIAFVFFAVLFVCKKIPKQINIQNEEKGVLR